MYVEAAGTGDRSAFDRLYQAVYDELRRMAEGNMRRERAGHTLQPTALVNEAYLRLVPNASAWEDRRHFFGAAAEAMRRILVDSARRKKCEKRGGQLRRVDLDAAEFSLPVPADELVLLDEALTRLANIEARAAEIVKLCFYVGLTQQQAAKELGISVATVERLWAFARAWLFREMRNQRER